MTADSWKTLDKWFNGQYVGSRHLASLEGGEPFHKLAASIATTPAMASGAKRMRDYLNLRYRYPLQREGYTCVAFSLVVASDRKTRSRPIQSTYAHCFYDHTGSPEYVSVSPTFDSKDGEYRHRLNAFKGFMDEYERIASDVASLEAAMLELIADEFLGLDVHCYPSEAEDSIKLHVESSRVSLKLLVVAMLFDLFRAKSGLLQIHAHNTYVRAFTALAGAHPVLAAFVEKPYSDSSVNVFAKNSKYALQIECGFKFTPLTEREVVQPMDVNFSAWRELYARQIASDLVLNGISPSFALENQWTFIEGVDQTLFENTSMHRRYDLSSVASQAIAHVRQARAELSQTQLPETDGTVSALDAHIYESIEYAQSFMLMSKIALCSTMEHVGSTVASIPGKYARLIRPDFHLAAIYGSCDHFAKICFDILYGLHCLHVKAHLAHGDLHGNNMTIHQFADAYKHSVVQNEMHSRAITPGPIVAYVAGPRGEADTYVFPYTGLVGVIIDFSRSIYGPGMAPQLVKDFGQPFTTSFYRDQVTRAVRTFHRYAPSFTEKHQEQLKAALLANFDSAFRVLGYADFLAVGNAMVFMLEKYQPQPADLRKFTPNPGLAVFAKKIVQASRDRLVTYLHDLVEPHKAAPIPYAGEVLLPELFSAFKYSAWENLEYGLDRPKSSASRHKVTGVTAAGSTTAASSAAASPDVKTAASPADAKNTPAIADAKTAPLIADAKNAPPPANAKNAPPLIIYGSDVSSPTPDKCTLCDLYNINAPVRWSGRDYDSFPPWARADAVEAHAAGLKFADIIARDSAPFLAVATTKDRRVAAIAERMRAELDALDRPAGATSSWL